LENRQTHVGEYLNTLGTILILLLAGSAGTAGIIFNFKGGNIDLGAVNIWIVIALLLIPIWWRISSWVGKRFCCLFHRVGFVKRLCNFFKWIRSFI
jgi:hypothetical protein